jgi:hypothetical protein
VLPSFPHQNQGSTTFARVFKVPPKARRKRRKDEKEHSGRQVSLNVCVFKRVENVVKVNKSLT